PQPHCRRLSADVTRFSIVSEYTSSGARSQHLLWSSSTPEVSQLCDHFTVLRHISDPVPAPQHERAFQTRCTSHVFDVSCVLIAVLSSPHSSIPGTLLRAGVVSRLDVLSVSSQRREMPLQTKTSAPVLRACSAAGGSRLTILWCSRREMNPRKKVPAPHPAPGLTSAISVAATFFVTRWSVHSVFRRRRSIAVPALHQRWSPVPVPAPRRRLSADKRPPARKQARGLVRKWHDGDLRRENTEDSQPSSLRPEQARSWVPEAGTARISDAETQRTAAEASARIRHGSWVRSWQPRGSPTPKHRGRQREPPCRGAGTGARCGLWHAV
ncbi:unnamed protein product, partial [Pleuronectes platessa]